MRLYSIYMSTYAFPLVSTWIENDGWGGGGGGCLERSESAFVRPLVSFMHHGHAS